MSTPLRAAPLHASHALRPCAPQRTRMQRAAGAVLSEHGLLQYVCIFGSSVRSFWAIGQRSVEDAWAFARAPLNRGRRCRRSKQGKQLSPLAPTHGKPNPQRAPPPKPDQAAPRRPDPARPGQQRGRLLRSGGHPQGARPRRRGCAHCAPRLVPQRARADRPQLVEGDAGAAAGG